MAVGGVMEISVGSVESWKTFGEQAACTVGKLEGQKVQQVANAVQFESRGCHRLQSLHRDVTADGTGWSDDADSTLTETSEFYLNL